MKNMLVWAALLASTAVTVGVTPEVALAADGPDDSARADELYRRGIDAFSQRKVEEAYGLLAEAYKLKQSVDIAANLGVAEAMLGKSRDAAEHLAKALRAYPVDGSAEAREKLSARLADVKKKVGLVRIKAAEADVAVSLAGQVLGKTPFAEELYVEPGTTTLIARKQGFEDLSILVQVDAGGESDIELKLKPGSKKIEEPKVTVPADKPLWPTLALAGGAAAGLGVGIGMIVMSESARGTIVDSSCRSERCAADYQDEVDGYNLGRTVAVPAFIVGGLSLAGMITYLAIPAEQDESPRTTAAVRFAPWAGPGGAGGFVWGQF